VHFRIARGGRRFTRGDAERHVDLVLAGVRALAEASTTKKAIAGRPNAAKPDGISRSETAAKRPRRAR